LAQYNFIAARSTKKTVFNIMGQEREKDREKEREIDDECYRLMSHKVKDVDRWQV